MSYIKKIVLVISLLGLVVMGGFAYYIYQSVFVPNTAFNNNEAHIYISTGATFTDVVEEISPLLNDMDSFIAVANKKGYPQNIKAGHFIIEKDMSNNEIINAIRIGNIPITVKFNNQERLENLAGTLARQMEQDSTAFLNAFRDKFFIEKNGFTKDNALVMYIPNTYELYWNLSATGFRDRMLKEYNAFWNKNRTQKATQLGYSKAAISSLAAIVQKETVKVDERPRVAGVYINRLKKGMLLQADPTVIYSKKITENDFDQEIKRVLYKDLEIDSPFNTYLYKGVPPGPIAMPDISSIDAILNYENHDYYYFVANVQNFGYHKFAKTLSQHNRNKKEYTRWLSQQNIKR